MVKTKSRPSLMEAKGSQRQEYHSDVGSKEAEGLRYMVDIDLSKFLDRVQHDRLMSRLATRIEDQRVLKLIRRFLTAGVMIDGLESPTEEGTPQGGPLSPLLSNVVLDELDEELERRGLHFVRYADDCVIFVRSERAGKRVMESVSRFIEKKLRLKVNHEKSAVGRPWDRKYLGFCTTNTRRAPKLRIHWKTIQRFRDRVREITAHKAGRSLRQVIEELTQYISGWWSYFCLTESVNRLCPLAPWVRRRLRALVWKQWKNRPTRVRELRKRGISRLYALTAGCARKGPWRMSKVKWVQIALTDAYFQSFGLFNSIDDPIRRYLELPDVGYTKFRNNATGFRKPRGLFGVLNDPISHPLRRIRILLCDVRDKIAKVSSGRRSPFYLEAHLLISPTTSSWGIPFPSSNSSNPFSTAAIKYIRSLMSSHDASSGSPSIVFNASSFVDM